MLHLVTAGAQPRVDPYESSGPYQTQNQIDVLVRAGLERRGIPPANLCSDEVFMRRAHLDLIGTLPTAEEVREFLAKPGAGKRSALIDALLKREELADYWSLKWCDLLRVKSEYPINLWPNAVQACPGVPPLDPGGHPRQHAV